MIMEILKSTEKHSVGPSITGTGDQRCGSCFNQDICDGGLYTETDKSTCLIYRAIRTRIPEKWEVM